MVQNSPNPHTAPAVGAAANLASTHPGRATWKTTKRPAQGVERMRRGFAHMYRNPMRTRTMRILRVR